MASLETLKIKETTSKDKFKSFNILGIENYFFCLFVDDF